MRLNELLDLTLPELLLIENESRLKNFPAIKAYLSALIAFFEGDEPRLVQILSFVETQNYPECSIVAGLISARIILFRREYSESAVIRLLSIANKQTDWNGEAKYLLATLYFDQGRFHEAEPLYLSAHETLLAIGANKKALNCMASAVAARSWIFPKNTLFAEYWNLYREARRIRYSYVAGSALINLSREFQKLGALGSALRFGIRAIAACKRDIGGISHFSALTHYCDLLIDAGRTYEAELILDYCLAAEFPAVQSSTEILRAKLKSQPLIQCDSKKLTPIWKEKLLDIIKSDRRPALAPLEDMLLAFIAEHPRTRKELREFLYGRVMPVEVADARLKSVLERVRRKYPGLVTYAERDGIYILSRELHRDSA